MILTIQRHLFTRLLKAFILFIVLLLTTYTLLDFCTKAADFSESNSINYGFMLRFYGCEFSKKAHLFVPLCFSLAMLMQFIRLSKTKELVALLCSGMSYRKILTPFWVMSVLLTSFLILNRQYIVPPARDFLEGYRNDHVRAARRARNSDDQINAIILKDDSKLIYQSFDPTTQRYFDLFWIISPNRILRIKYLDQTPQGYKAQFIDELTRNQSGTLQKKHSFKELVLSKEWLKGAHIDKTLPIQNLPLQQMVKGLGSKESAYSPDEIYTELFLVLIMCLAPLWLVLMQSPMIAHYSRNMRVMFYVASQLLFFFCTSTILDGLGVISQRSIISPWLLIFTPALIGVSYLYKRYRTELS